MQARRILVRCAVVRSGATLDKLDAQADISQKVSFELLSDSVRRDRAAMEGLKALIGGTGCAVDGTSVQQNALGQFLGDAVEGSMRGSHSAPVAASQYGHQQVVITGPSQHPQTQTDHVSNTIFHHCSNQFRCSYIIFSMHGLQLNKLR